MYSFEKNIKREGEEVCKQSGHISFLPKTCPGSTRFLAWSHSQVSLSWGSSFYITGNCCILRAPAMAPGAAARKHRLASFRHLPHLLMLTPSCVSSFYSSVQLTYRHRNASDTFWKISLNHFLSLSFLIGWVWVPILLSPVSCAVKAWEWANLTFWRKDWPSAGSWEIVSKSLKYLAWYMSLYTCLEPGQRVYTNNVIYGGALSYTVSVGPLDDLETK